MLGLGDRPLSERVDEDTTIAELREQYPEEAVNRAIDYLESLMEAEDSYKESVEEGGYAEGWAEGLGADIEDGAAEDMDEEWAEESKRSGLGIEDE
jgi:hypothetical protein